MPRHSRPASEPDLFSLGPAAPRPAPPAEVQAAVVPDAKPAIRIDDLGRMIVGWSDAEVEHLRVIVTNEIQRRGLLTEEAVHASPSAVEVERAASETVRQPKREGSVQEVA